MAFREISSLLRRRWRLGIVLFLLIFAAYAIQSQRGESPSVFATSKLIIGPDPLIASQSSLPILEAPIYLSFLNKQGSITEFPILKRAAELARGDRAFEGKLFDREEVKEKIATGTRRIRDEFGTDEDALLRLLDTLRSSVRVVQIPRRQIVLITCVAEDETAALLKSWAISEAACQFHAERARVDLDRFLGVIKLKILESEPAVQAASEEYQAAQKRIGTLRYEERSRWALSELAAVNARREELFLSVQRNRHIINARLDEGQDEEDRDLELTPAEMSSLLRNLHDQLKLISCQYDAVAQRILDLDPEEGAAEPVAAFRVIVWPRNPR